MCKIWDFGHSRIRTMSFNENYLVLIKKSVVENDNDVKINWYFTLARD